MLLSGFVCVKAEKTKIQFIPYNGQENTFFQKYPKKIPVLSNFFTF